MAKPLISGRLVFLSVAVFLIIATSSIFCQSAISNEQLLAEASKRAASVLFDSLNITTGTFTISSERGIDEIVAGGVIDALQKNNCLLANLETSLGDSIVTVKVRLSALQFTYQKGESRGFWKKPYVKRSLIGQMAVILSGKYNYSGFRDIAASDQVLFGQLNIMASPKYNQLAPEIPRLGASRFVEPLAVAASVGGLIYLFFASR
jgi:hypothetical protein